MTLGANGLFIAAAAGVFSGHIDGAGGLEIGSGTQTLSGVNTYSNATQIDTGATLALKGAGSIANTLYVGFAPVANGPAVFDISQTTNGASAGGLFDSFGVGSVLLGSKTLTITNGSFFNGVIADGGAGGGSSGGITVAASAVQQLGGVNTYTGLTTINAGGELDLIQNGSIAASSGVVTNGTFDISSLSAAASIKSLSGGLAGLVNLGGNGVTVTNAAGTFAGTIADGGVNGGTAGGLTIAGGTQVLSGTNTYTGATTVSAGTLAIAEGGSITSNVTNNATFTNAGTVTGSLTNTGTASNSGTITGPVTNNAGSFTQTAGSVGGGLTNAAIVNANGGAINGAVANNGGTFNVGGTVTSNSTFTNAADATLTLLSAGNYTLQGLLTNSGVITVANGGTLVATVGGISNLVGGSITVAFGGKVRDDLNNASSISNGGTYVANVAANTAAGVITNNATGTWTGNVLSNAAVITNSGAWTGNVVSSTGTINNNLTWTGIIASAGTFNNTAAGTVSGLLTQTAGVSINDGSLNGGALINGGVFSGTGSVTNVTVDNGGVFAPGNGAPGSSMTVTGNLALQSGAFYLVALNPATSSFANVLGTASLNGGAGAAFLTGNYIAKQYTILTAAGGVAGTFSSFNTLSLPSGFNASLSYDPNNVFLNLALNFTPPPGSGLNVNQRNTGNAVVGFFNRTGGIPAVFGGLTTTTLTIASGELPTASQQATFNSMNLFLGLLTDPFVGGRGEGAAGFGGMSSYADEAMGYAAKGRPGDALAAIYRKAPPPVATFEQRWSTWVAGYGGSQTSDGNATLGSNSATASVYGTAVGADYRFSPSTLAGFALAGGGTNFSIANGLGSGRSDLFQAGALLRHTAGPAYITAALAYGWQDVTTDRTLAIAGIDRLRGRFDANAWSGRIEAGARYATPWMGITPYAAGQFTTYELPNYAEHVTAGASTFALNYAAKDVTAARSEFGLRADRSYAMQGGIFTLRGRAAWAHNFNPDRSISATFQTLPGASFTVNGASQSSDAALTTASAEMKWRSGWSAAATFEGEFSDITRSYAGKGVVRYAW